jgi:hypothetical protein
MELFTHLYFILPYTKKEKKLYIESEGHLLWAHVGHTHMFSTIEKGSTATATNTNTNMMLM